ncbi:MAG: hypothetical protein AUG50_02115 [Betaproteobacteria bacterium 13_1_20CM_3_63_8]|nr:MAG: hypothetical protein AUG50_02115 [Betaproteobacteria bacterium 13_1_20CM_3_63_8]
MRSLALFLALILAAPAAFAQADRKKGQSMSHEERQRMREDMREAYRDRGDRNRPPDRGRQMSPQEREKLRRDIQDANRDLKR